MDDGIQFGEVEEASPQTSLRPDRNKHFAVAPYEAAAERDLPIFVDLDVLHDMEQHALSDTSVELGGVLLGGVYDDEDGRPFVVVTDSLRAQHYESTKGSFKFTHDTWSAISRERDQFPAELAMVGWYHTHPDWGVFLSSMDMFICDNFFNKRLDVALVIDPCRGDRGMFQWTGDPKQRVRRTGGFFVTASRFRAAELEHYVAELSGTMPATTRERATSGGYGQPVVHLHQPPPPPPPAWQGPAVVGMLALQFCLLALIAWKMIEPTVGRGDSAETAELSDLKEAVAARAEADAALEKVRWRTEMLDQFSSEMKGTGPGFVERMQEKFDQAQRLSADVEARDALVRDLKASLSDTTNRLHSTEFQAKGEQERLSDRIDSLSRQLDRQLSANKDLTARIAVLDPPKPDPAKEGAKKGAVATNPYTIWWYVGGGVLAAVVLVAGIWMGSKSLTQKVEQANEPADETPGADV